MATIPQHHSFCHVFAYGSLMAPSSLRESLPDYDFQRFPPQPVRLEGFRKAFSAVYPNSAGFATADGCVPRWVAYLNVEPAEDESAPGVLLTVSPEQFSRLEAREQGYHCLDVTTRVQVLGNELPKEERVFTFSFPHCPELAEGDVGRIGVGIDYQEVIARACAEVDAKWGFARLIPDFAEVRARAANWPQLEHSNPRSRGGYR